jgi:hypothetical protein
MINFTQQELDYIKGEFEELLYSSNEDVVICREDMDKQLLSDMKDWLGKLELVNSSEELNKQFVDCVYFAIGFYVWVCDYSSLEVADLCGDMYAQVFSKVVFRDEE